MFISWIFVVGGGGFFLSKNSNSSSIFFENSLFVLMCWFWAHFTCCVTLFSKVLDIFRIFHTKVRTKENSTSYTWIIMCFTFVLTSKGAASLGCFEISKIPGTNPQQIGSKYQKFLYLLKFSGQQNIWDKVFKNEPIKCCGRQTFKKLEGIWSA